MKRPCYIILLESGERLDLNEANELGAWNLLQLVLLSGERFNDSDKWFFIRNGYIYSFSTEQEYKEVMNNLMNEYEKNRKS